MKSFDELFENQINENKPITKESLSQLKGKGFYGKYKEGDILLWFLKKENDVMYKLETVTKRELNKLEKDFEFIEMKSKFPCLRRRK